MSLQPFRRATCVLAMVFAIACGGEKDRAPAATSPTPTGLAPVLAPVRLERIDLDRPSLDGGQAANATLFLNREASADGAVITLSSTDPAVRVPASITVPAGQVSASVPVTTVEVDGDTPVKIMAAAAGQTPLEAAISINTLARLESFSRVSPYVRGGTRGTIAIRLQSRLNRRLVMRIASTDPDIVAPQTVTMEAGAAVLNWEFSTPVILEDRETVLSTTVGGQPYTQQIVANPAPSIEFTNSNAGAFPSGRTRLDASNGLFRATACCRATQLMVDVNWGYGNGYLVYFRAPKDTPINPGTYESSSTSAGIPGFYLVSDNNAPACTSGGTARVTVKRASFQQNGILNRFLATFEQRCSNGGSVSGEISLDAAAPSPFGCSC